MSKIGQVNLDLQEQAEALGFESVQEALDNGYRAFMNIDGTNKLIKMEADKDVIQANTDALAAMEQAHKDYLHRKQIIINNLEMLMADTPYKVYKDTLQDAINFLKEKEV